MAEGVATAGVTVVGDTTPVEAAFATLPRTAKQAASDAAKALKAEMKAAEKAAKDATKAAEKAAKDAARAVEKAAKDAQRATEKAAAEAKADFNKATAGAAAFASSLGGPFARLGSLANSALKPIADVSIGMESMGGVALGATAVFAGLAVGTYALATGLHAFIEGADGAIKRLDAISGTPPLPADSIKSLDRYRQSALGAEAQADRFKVQVAALAAEAFEPAMAALGGLIVEMNKAVPSVQEFGQDVEAVKLVTRSLLATFTLGISEALRFAIGLDDLAAEGRAAAEGLDDTDRAATALAAHMSAAEKIVEIQADALLAMTGASDGMQAAFKQTEAIDKATQEYIATLDLAVPAEKALADAAISSGEVRKKQIMDVEAAKEAAKALTKAQQEQTKVQAALTKAEDAADKRVADYKKAQQDLTETVRESALAFLTPQGQIISDSDERIRKIRELEKATGDQVSAEKAVNLEYEYRQQLLDDLARKTAQSNAEALRQGQAFVDNWTSSVKDAQRQAGETIANTTATGLGAIQTLTDATVQNYQDRQDAGEKLSRYEIRSANTAIAASKILALAQAGISATLAAMGFIAQQSVYLGPAAIPIGIGLGAGMFAAAAASIATGGPMHFAVPSGGGTPGIKGDAASTQANDDAVTGHGGSVTQKPDIKTGDPGSGRQNRSSQNGYTEHIVTIDPRIKTIAMTSSVRFGKRPRRGGR